MPKISTDIKAAILITILAVTTLSIGVYYIISVFLNSSITLPAPAVSVARNWAGYLIASDMQNPQATALGVSGSWVVPSVTDIGTDAFSAIWVGIGGQFDHTLIQTGTEQDFVNGSPVYYAWYELLPQDAIVIDSMTVSPGDQIQAAVTLVDPNSNLWSISLIDTTNGQSFQENFTYSSGQSSAEWIVERPQVNNVLSELANFGSATFSSCQANLAGTTGSITNFPYSAIIMDAQVRHNQTVQIVNVSTLTSQGTQFTVNYIA